LIAQDSVSVLLGLPESREAIPVATVAEENQVLMISTHSTNPQTTANKQYVFRMPFLDPFQGQLMAEFARHTLDIDRAAVLYDVANPYNKGLAEAFIHAFEAQGGQIVASEIYTFDTNQDFTQQLERIRASQPGALFLPNLTPDVHRQARQAYRLGLEAILLGGDGWNANEFADEPALQNSFFSELWAPDMPNEESKQFIARYSKRYEIQPTEQAATTYDTFGVLFQAIQTANSLEPADIRQGLLQMGPYHGVSGSILYKDSGDPIRSAVILQIKDNRAETYKVIHP
jgi:branched-chain amino acid transport system substrate-binding protein